MTEKELLCSVMGAFYDNDAIKEWGSVYDFISECPPHNQKIETMRAITKLINENHKLKDQLKESGEE